MDSLKPEGRMRLTRADAPDRLVCTFHGDVDQEALLHAAQRIGDVLAAADAPAAVELDLRDGRTSYAFADLITAAERVLERSRPVRVALIGEEGRTDTHLMVLETVSFPHGSRVRRFAEPDQAAAWLSVT